MEILLEKGIRKVEADRFHDITEPLRVTVLEPYFTFPADAFAGCTDVTIRAHSGSFAEFYAKKHGLKIEKL